MRAAGLMMVDPQGRVLLLRRSAEVDNAGQWNLPGGHRESGERLVDAAFREAFEEAGWGLELPVVARYDDAARGYTTFVVRVPAAFRPELNWESDAWTWATCRESRRLNLHAGLRALLW